MSVSSRPPNPFVRTGPDHHLFLPRPGLDAQIGEALSRYQSVALIGDKGIGKSRTSRQLFKQYLRRKALKSHFFCVRVELTPSLTVREALKILHHRYKEELLRRGLSWGDVPWVSDLDAPIPEVIQAFEQLFLASEDEGSDLIWFFDPMTPEIATTLAPLWEWLSHWIARWGRVLVCVSRVEDLPKSWQDKVEPILIPPFSRRETWRYLLQATKGTGWKISRNDVGALFEQSRGNPGALRAAAALWWEQRCQLEQEAA